MGPFFIVCGFCGLQRNCDFIFPLEYPNINLMSRLLVILLLAVLSGCSVAPGLLGQQEPPNQQLGLTVGSAALSVEVAGTDAAREQGLSDRESLPANSGMLFVFATPAIYEFWMKDMRFALDFLWLKNGKVVELAYNVPPPTSRQPEPVRLRPTKAVDMVIEVPAGWLAANRVREGDEVSGLPARVDK